MFSLNGTVPPTGLPRGNLFAAVVGSAVLAGPARSSVDCLATSAAWGQQIGFDLGLFWVCFRLGDSSRFACNMFFINYLKEFLVARKLGLFCIFGSPGEARLGTRWFLGF